MMLSTTLMVMVLAQAPVLRLADAERLTLEHQPVLRQARASATVSDARTDEALSALLPSLNGTVQATRSHGAFARAGSTGGSVSATTVTSTSTNNFFSVGLSASVPVWDFGAIQRFRASGHVFEAGQATIRAVTLQVLLNTRKAFFAARASNALLKVAEESLANQKKHLEQIDQFVKAGLRTGIDLAQTQTLVSNAELALVNARNTDRLARAQVRQAIGWGGLGDFTIAGDELPAGPHETEPLEKLVALALDARPEVFGDKKLVDAQALTVSAQKSGFLPTLAATGSLQEAGTSLDALGLNWSFGAVLSWNLFQGGNTRALVRESTATGDSLSAQLDGALVQVQLDVETARFTVEDEQEAILAATQVVAAAKAQLALAEGRYTQGVGSILELSDAQVAATTAAAQLVQTQLSLMTARAQLSAALGEMP